MPTGHSFSPGGNITTPAMKSLGTFNGGSGAVTVNGALTIAGGTFNGGTAAVWVQGFTLSNGAFTSTSGTMDVYGNFSSTGGTFDANGGTVEFYGGYNATVTRAIDAGALQFNNVQFSLYDDAAGILSSSTFTITGALTVNGSLTLTYGGGGTDLDTMVLNNGTIYVKGNFAGSMPRTSGTTAITLDGTLDQTISASDSPNGTFTIDKASGLASISAAATLGSAFVVQQGTFNTGGYALTVNNTVTVNGGAFNAGASATSFGAFTMTGGTFNGGTGSFAASSMTINGGTFIIGNSLSVTGALTVGAAGTLQLRGSETITRGSLALNSGSTVVYTGSGSYTGFPSGLGNSYSNLTINGTGAWTLNAPLTAGRDLTIANATLDVSGGSYNISIARNFSNSGTFNSRFSTVTLNGQNQAIYGNISFYNLTKIAVAPQTLTFEAGKTYTIRGIVTLKGAATGLLSLRSSTPGTRWNFIIEAAGAKDISYVDVQDSDASWSGSVHLPINPANSLNSGNTAGWFDAGMADPNVTGFPGGSAVVDSVSQITASATFSGDADADGATLFEYSTGGPWTPAPCGTGGSVTGTTPRQCPITGLSPNTDYNIRLTISDPDGATGANPLTIGPYLTYPGAPPSITVSSPFLTTGLAGLWHMNEGSGGTVGDASGNLNNGSCSNVATNLATGGAASASGTHGSYNDNGPKDGQGSPWGTCPGSCSTWAEGSSSTLAWWQVDIGSIMTINQVKVLSSTTASNAYYKVQISTNGSTWTDVGSTTQEGWVTFDFALSSARYVRVQETQNNGNGYLYLTEVEVYNNSMDCTWTTGILSSGGTFFDSWDDYVGVPNSASLDINGAGSKVSIEAWFKPTTLTPTWQNIFYKGNSDSNCVETACSDRQYTMWLNTTGYVHFTSTSVNNIGVTQTAMNTPSGIISTGQC